MKCKNCKEDINLESIEIWFDESGTGYSTKLCKCSHCGSIQVIRYYEDLSLDINNDDRYYRYSK